MCRTLYHNRAPSEGQNEGCGGGLLRLRLATGYCLRLPRVAFEFPQTKGTPLYIKRPISLNKRERFQKATSDLPTTASREHPKYALERPCRSVLRLAPRCANEATSMRTDAQPCAVVGRFALVALPFALAGFAQVRAVLPVGTSVALEETQSVGL